jgi:hypothetical protein
MDAHVLPCATLALDIRRVGHDFKGKSRKQTFPLREGKGGWGVQSAGAHYPLQKVAILPTQKTSN